MYAHAEKCHAKKITQFKFSFFQKSILCEDNRYLFKGLHTPRNVKNRSFSRFFLKKRNVCN